MQLRKPEINECVRIALGRRIVVDIEESSFINSSPDFGTNQADFTEQTAGFQSLKDDPMPHHLKSLEDTQELSQFVVNCPPLQ